MTAKELQNALSAICEQIACGNYEQAKAVFDLSPCEPADDPQNLLVEALGMMLLRVEAREFELERLLGEISDARTSLKQNHLRLTQENRRLRKRMKARQLPTRPVAQAPSMQILLRQAEQAAQCDSPILIHGETGTGKDLFAKHIHTLGIRADKPFVPINFSSISASRIEMELFGMEEDTSRGRPMKAGRLELADGGTILLNEIRALPQEIQKKLLKAMDVGTIKRINGKKSIPINVRFIATTNRDVEQAVKKGYFLQELLERLKTIHLALPPLRERWEDIPVLAKLFLAHQLVQIPHAASSLSDHAMSMPISYHWPGNVRELENVVRNASLIAEDDCIHPKDLGEVMGPGLSLSVRPHGEPSFGRSAKLNALALAGLGLGDSTEEGITLADIEAAHIKKILTLTSGNKSKAAQILGISREGLRTKLMRVENSHPDSP